jgi:hypothetical protein
MKINENDEKIENSPLSICSQESDRMTKNNEFSNFDEKETLINPITEFMQQQGSSKFNKIQSHKRNLLTQSQNNS